MWGQLKARWTSLPRPGKSKLPGLSRCRILIPLFREGLEHQSIRLLSTSRERGAAPGDAYLRPGCVRACVRAYVCVRVCVPRAGRGAGLGPELAYSQRPSSVMQAGVGALGGRPWDVPARGLVFSQPPASPAWPSSARSRAGWRENRFPSSPASGGRVGRPGRPASARAGRSFPEEASRTERRHQLVNAGPRFPERGWCVNRTAVNHVASESYRHRAVKGKPL